MSTMRIIILLWAIGTAILISSCAVSTITESNFNNIAVCGAGISNSLEGKLDAEYRTTGGQVTTSYKDAIKAHIFESEEVSSTSKLEVYKAYLGCIEQAHNRQDIQSNKGKYLACKAIAKCTEDTQNEYFFYAGGLANSLHHGIYTREKYDEVINRHIDNYRDKYKQCFGSEDTIAGEVVSCYENNNIVIENFRIFQ